MGPDRPHDHLPRLPPKADIETRTVLKQVVLSRAALAALKQAADKGVAQRQAASRYLKSLAAIGVLGEVRVGKEKLFIHPRLMRLLSDDSHDVVGYAASARQ